MTLPPISASPANPAENRLDPTLVYLDPFLVERALLNAGLSRKGLAQETGQALNTFNRIYEREGLRPNSAHLIAKRLGHSVVELLAPFDPRYQIPTEGTGPGHGNPEWEVETYLDQGRQTPNGLYYITCRLRHRYTTQRLGRGKYFHLSWLRPENRKSIQHQLVRHTEVSARIGAHPHSTQTVSSQPASGDEGWWIVDEWVGGQTLAQQLLVGSLAQEAALQRMREIAFALQRLHAAQVVLRQLSPERILLADSDGRAVVTDFELAKLLDGPASVSRDWPIDPYLAPEVQGTTATVQSDLYSLGRVAAALLGGSAAMTDAAGCLQHAGLALRLKSLLVKCIAADPAQRPPSIDPLVKELSR